MEAIREGADVGLNGDDLAPPLDWDTLAEMSTKGRLLAHLTAHMPRAQWALWYRRGGSLLHVACMGDNADASLVLIKLGLDVNVPVPSEQLLPVHLASSHGSVRVLRVLCAYTTELGARNAKGDTALECSLHYLAHGCYMPLEYRYCSGTDECARVLIAHGMRLGSVRAPFAKHITPALVAFERGALRCRLVVLALLGIKRRRGLELRHMDR